jgi:tetratricopeptide (TPR) repeat protein
MKKIFLCLFFILTEISIFAQNVDDVTLVVSGDGATKEEATHVALRSAIEQAYGVFVSSNTEILNDELVKDEIVTIAQGNVKSYKELSAIVLQNGNHMVTLRAVVSTKKLATYAQSKGVSCEFAGATFGTNLKLHKLNVKNTEIAFKHLIKQMKSIAPDIFGVTLKMGDPRMSSETSASVNYTISLYSTPQMYELCNLIVSTLSALQLSPQTIASVRGMGFESYPVTINTRIGTETTYSATKWINKRLFEGHFYAPFPKLDAIKAIYNSLLSCCIIDNLGIIHVSHSPEGKISERIKSEIIDAFNVVLPSSSHFKWRTSKSYDFNGKWYCDPCFRFDHEIYLPYTFTAPKTKKKIFTNQLIGQVEGTIDIPVEVLVKINNFELVKFEDTQTETLDKNLHLAHEYLRQFKYQEALATYQYVNYLAENSEVYYCMAKVENLLQNYKQAANYIIKAIEYESQLFQYNNYHYIKHLRGILGTLPFSIYNLIPISNLNPALLDELLSLIKNKGDYYNWHCYLFAIYREKKQYKEALNELLVLKQFDDGLTKYQYDFMASDLYCSLGDFEMALMFYEDGLYNWTKSNTDAFYIYYLIEQFKDLNLLKNAMQIANYAIAKMPPHGYLTRPEVYFEMKEYKKAIEDYTIAIEQVETNKSLNHYFRYKRAYSYLLDGNFNRASTEFEYLLQEAEGELVQVYAMIHLHMFDQAREKIESMQLSNHDLACCYALMSETEVAFSTLESALKDGYTQFYRIRRNPDFRSLRGERLNSLLATYEKLQKQRIQDLRESKIILPYKWDGKFSINRYAHPWKNY